MADAHDTTEDSPLILGGRYRLDGLLGRGAMGSVYRARDLELDEIVAIKLLKPNSGANLADFRDEVRLARRVTHRNVARTYDIGDHEGAPFLTMEHVAGDSLRRMVVKGGLDERVARDLSRQVTAGLAAVHEEGIAHGDLKPENVLVTKERVVKVSDFGLARIIHPETPAALRGTPLYMAPEQLEGTSSANSTSDVYALGVVMYELFVGARPWPTVTDAAVEKLTREGVTVPEQVPRDMADVIEKCLRRDPRDRFADAARVLESLVAAESASRTSLPTVMPPTAPDAQAMRVAVRVLEPAVPADAYLGMAIASDLVRLLGASSSIAVIGAPLADDSDSTERQATVEGSVRRIGTSVRLAFRLVEEASGILVWAKSMQVPLTDLVGELSALAASIADALGASTARPAVARSSALKDPAVLELYMRARQGDFDRMYDDTTDGTEAYEALLAKVPDDPLVLSMHAMVLAQSGFRVFGNHARAQAQAEHALRLAPDLPEAHLALALCAFQSYDLETTMRASLRALTLSPSNAGGHAMLGSALLEIGEEEDALARMELALALDPRHIFAWSGAAGLRAIRGDDAGADAVLARAPKKGGMTTDWFVWLTRMAIAIRRGGEYPALLAREIAAHPLGDGMPLAGYRLVLERNMPPEQVEMLTAMFVPTRELAGPRIYSSLVVAEIAAHLGDLDTAERSVVAADDEGNCNAGWLRRSAPLQQLAGRPTFEAAIAHAEERSTRLRQRYLVLQAR